ncbi:hypothetical protein COU14_00125 [Candidatus Kaiserbacteria bacterium CG10_big_fil_rev_8_21_14_0_10_44_10]|uniref:Thioredoxin domain-containing protein n=1 Tax=Candidatus Kaiserbacteria bacterium CG10_big_fil_rev_8_21_14_0_10_44_10 TaxID=1974606 RepID=A0A2H0UIJ9_9BACT|nr:MAG: hypothetical protein COU14_00125 [Candidatus Kaiserbacteria bacterium CG10_big_fil_rev_8_21_14_0_10_44_10]
MRYNRFTMNFFLKNKLIFIFIILIVTIGLLILTIALVNNHIKGTYYNETFERQYAEETLLNESLYDFTVGNPSGRINLIIYADTDCPFCQKFEAAISELLRDYPNDVSVTYRQYKLPTYPTSHYEHLALECIGIHKGSDAYRQFQNTVLYQTDLSDYPDPRQDALDLAVDFAEETERGDLTKCINSSETEARIKNKLDTANILGVRQTPTWFVITDTSEGYKKYVGSVSYQKLKWTINASLSDNYLE